ncbi:DUF2157 domain-containing protein [Erythrobacter litoralis]|uniref:DUF2157 domain-containing protein n=1 Tax=Erythrobacter litoralis (strain HTCC2594) TaxID=314225 RepID=Q2N778_ERYLH|nr:DUF2157 domain-containing protein [Erythrobacter litoralis]ABC64463.1 hypothetical protein ELI_11855 [Erythrobacter litoralis HTCC2594]
MQFFPAHWAFGPEALNLAHMGERKLREWREAGLIDDAAVARILAYEEEHSRPLLLWAVIGIGALAIGLGVISVVAANWEDVPGKVRLAIHLALFTGLAGFIGWRGGRLEREQPWGLEAALFVLGVLGMTFFGHIGQVYQTASPLWKPLAAALVLFGPIVLLRGQSWITASLFMGTLIATCWEYAFTLDQWVTGREADSVWLPVTLVTLLPIVMGPVAAWMRSRSARAAFWTRIEQLAVAYIVIGASLMCLAASVDAFSEPVLALGAQVIRCGAGLAVAGLIVWARRDRSGEATGMVLAASALACIFAYVASGATLPAGVLFMLLWAAIAAAALYAGWRGVFQAAVAVVALRLIVLSFELASDLLSSGFGLILAGLLILGVAWGAVRVSRAFAPPRENEGETL